jgi:GNAT superfamily N-acetyltransferase
MAINYRRFESQDRMPVYRMFRDSIWDYMLHHRLAHNDDEPEIEDYFRRQQNLYLHLEQTACEDWVAEDERLAVIGWARSIERDNHLQLTHFFVSTAAQGRGVGRKLLDLAFPPGRGQQRSIIATTNTSALSLYLRQDVSFTGMAFSFFGEPQERKLKSDLEIARTESSSKTLQDILAIDREVLGYRRSTDLEFFMSHQPVYLFRRDGRLAAYAFGCDGNSAGPAAALDPQDLPALLQQIEKSACQLEMDSLWLTIPAAARQAVDWALASGYRMDPFHEVLLAREPSMKLDRYIMTESAFLW